MNFARPAVAAMTGYVPGEQPQGGKFIKLNTNENPYPCSPAVARAIAARLDQGLGRYPDPQATAFRQRAADLFDVTPDWICCGNGSDDLLTILVRTFVDAGQTLRMPTPSYLLYRTLAQIQGARIEETPFAADWSLPDAFDVADERLKLVFLPNPNSPSGTLIPPGAIEALAERLPCPLVVDEAYGEFARENCVELVRRCPNVIVTRSLSKAYALAGLRFGYAIAQPRLIAELRKVKDSYNCDALAIAGATAAIDDEAWLAETRAKIIATRERMAAALTQLGFQLTDSQANFVWAVHPERNHRELFQQLKARQILVRYMDYPGWGDGLRISVGADSQANAFLDVLADLVGRGAA